MRKNKKIRYDDDDGGRCWTKTEQKVIVLTKPNRTTIQKQTVESKDNAQYASSSKLAPENNYTSPDIGGEYQIIKHEGIYGPQPAPIDTQTIQDNLENQLDESDERLDDSGVHTPEEERTENAKWFASIAISYLIMAGIGALFHKYYIESSNNSLKDRTQIEESKDTNVAQYTLKNKR